MNMIVALSAALALSQSSIPMNKFSVSVETDRNVHINHAWSTNVHYKAPCRS